MIGTRRHQKDHFVKRLEPLSPADTMESALARARRILAQQPYVDQVDIVTRWRGRSGKLEEKLLQACRRTDPPDVLCPGTEDAEPAE